MSQLSSLQPPTTQKETLSILVFGDSLTEGYTQWGLRFTPYSDFLLPYLQSHLGASYEITIRTEGVSGDLITSDFEERMEDICKLPQTFSFAEEFKTDNSTQIMGPTPISTTSSSSAAPTTWDMVSHHLPSLPRSVILWI